MKSAIFSVTGAIRATTVSGGLPDRPRVSKAAIVHPSQASRRDRQEAFQIEGLSENSTAGAPRGLPAARRGTQDLTTISTATAMRGLPVATWATQALAVDSTAGVSDVDHSLIQAGRKGPEDRILFKAGIAPHLHILAPVPCALGVAPLFQ